RSRRDRADLCEAALMVEIRGEGLLIVDSVKVTMRSYLSTAHLWMARHCAAYTSKYETQHKAERSAFHIHQRAYVMSAVTEAVAFVEALINEFFTDIHDSHADRYDSLGPEVLATIRGYWSIAGSGNNVSVLTKYEMALLLCGKPAYDKGAEPYQSMKAAIDLRNWQIHYRPKNVGDESSYDVAKRLVGKFPDCALMAGSGNAWFPDRALGAGCAQWAVSSALAFADHFVETLGVEPNYRIVQHPDEPPPIPAGT
ncbi:hypothetical protein ACFFTK_14565, partial [Pseudonocardia petroleophila]|uniref:hypothetical protein n=1 Tax=Pseudonocardia petroleophila TaxID=37331 RepID=UPI0035E92B2F